MDNKWLGIMAGSSMDGLDMVAVEFYHQDDSWHFKVKKTNTFVYDSELFGLLNISKVSNLSKQKQIDKIFGEWIANKIIFFEDSDKIENVALHGHTVTHDPKKKISWQIGNPQVVADKTRKTVVADFRSKDMKMGGEGAPLAPFGDFKLFSSFDACLNLGGIANVSVRNTKMGWDICPCNQVLNFFSEKLGVPYDPEGSIAASTSTVDEQWIEDLSTITYFSTPPPKSLPNQFIPIQKLEKIDPKVGLRSYVNFIVAQITQSISQYCYPSAKILVTGGGAKNHFLMNQLREHNVFHFVIPENKIVEFKEAILFAFMGFMRLKNKINVLSSVTNAYQDSCSGKIYFPV